MKLTLFFVILASILSAQQAQRASHAPLHPTGHSSQTPTAVQDLTLSVNPPTAKICAGSTIILTVTGASSYTWSPYIGLSGTGNGSTIAASPNSTTTYTVYGVSGASSGTVTVTIIVDTSLSIDITPKAPVICPSQSVVLTASGAATSYTWSPASGLSATNGNTVNVSPNATQIYTVQGSDAMGCTGWDTVTISVAPLPPASAGNPTVLTCASQTVSLSGSGGGGYLWSGPGILSGGSTPNPSVQLPGVYTVTVTSAYGCMASSSVSVSQDNSPPAISASGTQTLNCSPHTAVLSATATPGTASYSWTSQGGSIVGPDANSSVTVNQPGTYQVIVTNTANGCSSSAFVNVVNAPGVPMVTISPVSSGSVITCVNPSVALLANASPSGLSYAWSTGSNTPSTTVTSAGVVTLSVTNVQAGCTISTQYTVASNTSVPTLSVSSAVIPCSASSTPLHAQSSDPGVAYSWTGPGAGSIVSGAGTATPVVNAGGNYTVTVTDLSSGCSTTSVVTVVKNSVHAAFTASPLTGPAPLTVNFNNQSSAGADHWAFGDGYISSAANPSYVYSANGTYTVALIVSQGGCSDTAYAVIVVRDPMDVEVPNVFTPNGDTYNDLFHVTSYGVKEMTMSVFDRWGRLVFEDTAQDPVWDGNIKGGGKAPDGTYFYVIKASDEAGDQVEKKGSLSLFR